MTCSKLNKPYAKLDKTCAKVDKNYAKIDKTCAPVKYALNKNKKSE